jgi:WD40 repeat protein
VSLAEGTAVLILQSNVKPIDDLAFSPDGLSLAARGPSCLQVWPRWLDAPPQAVVESLLGLEDFAFPPDPRRIFLYRSANASSSRSLAVATGRHGPLGLPSGPAWFHFTETGGFAIVDHGSGKLSRYDYAPDNPKGIELRWTIERNTHGSHHAFGGIAGAAGVFVALEYRFDEKVSTDGVAVRSVEDGSEISRVPETSADKTPLTLQAGRRVALHPAGTCFAFGHGRRIHLRPLGDAAKVPSEIVGQSRHGFRGAAFHPSGNWLAAAGDDGTVKLYDTATWELSRTFAWKIGKLQCVRFTPDGTRAAAGSDTGQVVVWDVDG